MHDMTVAQNGLENGLAKAIIAAVNLNKNPKNMYYSI